LVKIRVFQNLEKSRISGTPIRGDHGMDLDPASPIHPPTMGPAGNLGGSISGDHPVASFPEHA
jgi:hypothetical protein